MSTGTSKFKILDNERFQNFIKLIDETASKISTANSTQKEKYFTHLQKYFRDVSASLNAISLQFKSLLDLIKRHEKAITDKKDKTTKEEKLELLTKTSDILKQLQTSIQKLAIPSQSRSEDRIYRGDTEVDTKLDQELKTAHNERIPGLLKLLGKIQKFNRVNKSFSDVALDINEGLNKLLLDLQHDYLQIKYLYATLPQDCENEDDFARLKQVLKEFDRERKPQEVQRDAILTAEQMAIEDEENLDDYSKAVESIDSNPIDLNEVTPQFPSRPNSPPPYATNYRSEQSIVSELLQHLSL